MTTGRSKLNFFVNRLMALKDFDERFMGYFVALMDNVLAAMLQGKSGVFEVDPVALANDGTDKFRFDITADKRIASGNGKLMVLAGNPRIAKQTEGIEFENTVATIYQVGARFNEVEAAVSVNPRKGIFEYLELVDVIGEVGPPDGVVDNATNIELDLTTLTDDIVGSSDYTGREVQVWLVDPVSGVESVAFYTGTIAWNGTNNYVQIPYSGGNGPLGQDTSSGPPSTTASDYKCWVKGPTVLKYIAVDRVTKSDPTNYVFFGEITGGVSPTFDITGQNNVFLITLDNAYTGPGSGAGNFINIDTLNKPLDLRAYTGQQALDPSAKKGMSYKDPDNNEIIAFGQYGRIAKTPIFEDEFIYDEGAWAAASSRPLAYDADEGLGLSRVRALGVADAGHANVFGAALIRSALGTDTASNMQMGSSFGLKNRKPRFFASFMLNGLEAGYTAWLGLSNIWTNTPATRPDPTGTFLGLEITSSYIRGTWFEAGDGNGGPSKTNTATLIATPSNNVLYQVMVVAINNDEIEFWVTGDTSPTTLILTGSGFNSATLNLDMSLGARVHSLAASLNHHDIVVDYWALWINQLLRSL